MSNKIKVIHYAPAGEWGGQRVSCGRYYTTDVNHTGLIKKVTCKRCLNPKLTNLKNKNN